MISAQDTILNRLIRCSLWLWRLLVRELGSRDVLVLLHEGGGELGRVEAQFVDGCL